jgi:predicted XRE-type DNA-binding protein
MIAYKSPGRKVGPTVVEILTVVVKYDYIYLSEFAFGKAEGGPRMRRESIEVVHGSGNVFRDFGRANADVEQLKAILAAEIIKTLDRQKLTVRAAHARTGIAAADFSRIRNADLRRFTVDRLLTVIHRLGSQVEVRIRVRALESKQAAVA